MTPRALALAQKLEWFSGKQVQDVDLKEIEQELAAVRREAIEEIVALCDEKISREVEMSRGIGGHAVFQCQAAIDALNEIKEACRALNGPGRKGR